MHPDKIKKIFHDIRNPLHNIIVFTDMLQRHEDIKKEYKEYFSVIQHSAETIRILTETIPGSGEIKGQIEPRIEEMGKTTLVPDSTDLKINNKNRDWLRSFSRAVHELDMEATLRLIEELAVIDNQTADLLKNYTHHFRFDILCSLTEGEQEK